ncbi:MAG: hypothetical protein COA73_00600 [Candidatus Hydrogenedentota bacterium]|nr:MAG: hypothetical protein COA73_00600 [Candidatus Hydrogenedentota bacterium]
MPEWAEDVQPVLKHLARLSIPDRMKFYGVKDAAKAKVVHTQNQACLTAPCIPAIQRYTGVVYHYLDYPTLGKKQAARKRIHIVSGLFGLIPGGTKIPIYKLPINPWLAKYWREVNTQRLAEAAKKKPVLSLLPQAYAKALTLDDVIHIDFRVQGGKKTAGHAGKAIKGRFVRFLIENGITDTKDFSEFHEDGFLFDGRDFVQP